jgi:hypothetical protein
VRLNVPSLAAYILFNEGLGRFTRDLPGVRLQITVEDGFTDIVAAGFDAGIRLLASSACWRAAFGNIGIVGGSYACSKIGARHSLDFSCITPGRRQMPQTLRALITYLQRGAASAE